MKCARATCIRSRILANRAPWPNLAVYSFHSMAEVAAHEILVTTDSDVEVSPRYLREIVPPMLDPKVGLVTASIAKQECQQAFFSGLTAIGMSVEMIAGVLVANLLKRMKKFSFGPSTVVRKDSLARSAGMPRCKTISLTTLPLVILIADAGYHVLAFVPYDQSMWSIRNPFGVCGIVSYAGRRPTRYSRPKGHFRKWVDFCLPYGLSVSLRAAGLGTLAGRRCLLGVALLNRVIEAWLAGWTVVRDPNVRRAPWLYPLRDLLGFAVWFASSLNLRYVWRDSRFELKGTRIALRQTSSNGR